MNSAILNESIRICNFIGDSVNNRTSFKYIPDEFALKFAEYNKCVTLLYSTLNNCGTTGGEFQKIALVAERELLKQLKNDVFQEKICEAFKRKSISYAVLKGTETRRFYPEYLMRTSNDIDIYIDSEDIANAKAELESLGFEFEKQNGNDFEFKQGGCYVELHISMGGITKQQKRYFSNLESKIKSSSEGLKREDHYIYAVYHLYKHFITAGAGARMFLDVYCMGKSQGIDRKYIEAALEKLDILRFEKMIIQINEVLFESKEASLDVLELLEYIFENGAYGSESAAKHLKYAGAHAVKQRSVKHILDDLCLDADSMIKRYDILNKCFVLYPFCVIHRVVKGMIFRKKNLTNAVDTAKEIFTHRKRYCRILKISGIL